MSSWQQSSWQQWGNSGYQSNGVQKPMFNKSSEKSWSPSESKYVGDDFVVDTETRYQGTVTEYWKWQGYGFITPDPASGLKVPKDKIYVHYISIQTDDRYPFLIKDMQVEFCLHKKKEGPGKYAIQARHVTMPGGIQVAVQDDQDAVKKTFVGGQFIRYTGMLKFYNPTDKFGYVKLDDGFALDASVPKELRVEECEVNCGGKRPQKWIENIAVEFGIHKTKGGHAMVYNMTLPGAVPLARETLENRSALGPMIYKGKIQYWSKQGWWGHIAPEALMQLPAQVRAKLDEGVAEAKRKNPSADSQPMLYFRKQDCARGFWPEQGSNVIFQLYQDDKGFGACEVRSAQ